jgi:hypothetical protein
VIQFIGDLSVRFLIIVGAGILLGGFFQAIHKVIGKETKRGPWEGWRR